MSCELVSVKTHVMFKNISFDNEKHSNSEQKYTNSVIFSSMEPVQDESNLDCNFDQNSRNDNENFLKLTNFNLIL